MMRSNLLKLCACSGFLACLCLIPYSGIAVAVTPQALFSPVSSADEQPVDAEPAVKRRRVVNVDLSSLQPLAVQQSLPEGAAGVPERPPVSEAIELNLFDDVVLHATRSRNYLNQSGSMTWRGTVNGQATSSVIFVIRDDQVYGMVEVPGVGQYSIRPNADGTHTVEEINPDALLSGSDDIRVPEPLAPQENLPLMENNVAISNDNGSIIDVYVAYDQDASGGSVSSSDAQSLAELFIAYTNQAYENSNISQRVWLVGTVDGYDYTDTDSTSVDAELTAITDGTISGLHDKRNEYHADLVVFLSPYVSTCNGVAWVQTTNGSVSWNTNGFAAMTACSFGQSVFAHELGHNMGSQHDWYMNNSTSPASIAHGYIDVNNGFRTIMSYSNRCNALSISCPTIAYFSNPAVSYNGTATGVASGTSTSCSVGDASPTVECDADNGTNFNNKAQITSQFRDSRVTWTGAIDTNWDTAGNWTFNQGAPGSTTATSRVPRAYDNVYIPSGVARYPVINGTASARELVIESGASLSMTGGTLSVGWSWEDEGGFSASGGEVILAGPIGVSVESSSTFNDVQIGSGSDTSEVTLNSNLDINGNLHIRSGASLNAGSYSINLAGNWTEDDATGFASAGTSTVILDGTSQAISKVTSVSVLSEDFSSYDSSCCTSSKPSGWASSDGAFYQGDLVTNNDGAANRWRNETDGYLYTPALTLKKGISYQLQYKVATRRNYSDGDGVLSPQTVSVYLGTAQSASAMTTTLSGPTSETSTSYQTRTISNITVNTSGTYYIGFRAQQSGDDYTSFDDIVLTGTGNVAFYNLQISSGTASFSKDVKVSNNLQVNSSATLDIAGNTISVEGTVTNNGAFKQTRTVSNGTATHVGRIQNEAGTVDKYLGVEITPGTGSMGSTTVQIAGGQTCSGGGVAATGVSRCYTITPTTNQTADVKFYYRDAESNGNSSPTIYLKNGGSWDMQTTSAHGGSGEAVWASGSGINSFGQFALSSGSDKSRAAIVPTLYLLVF